MKNEKLYKLAVEFYNRRLWLEMHETEIFGVTLPDEEIAYCSVIGKSRPVPMLAVFVGKERFDTFRRENFPIEFLDTNELSFQQHANDSLLCSFEPEHYLTQKELYDEQIFCKKNKITFRKKYSHPRFLKCEPYVCEVPINSQEDEEILTLALTAAIEVGQKYPAELPKNIAFPRYLPVRKKFPILTPNDDGFSWRMENLPPYRYEKYPVAKFTKSDIAKIKKAEKSKVWNCELFLFGEPLSDVKAKFFRYPVFLLATCEENYIDVPLTLNYASKPEELTKNFIETLLQNGVPEKICVRNDRTFDYLEKFCEECGIEICEIDEMPEIDEWEENFSFDDYIADDD